MIIGIDFDGTCVTHEFPYIGKDIGAVPVLKELVDKGYRLIIFTMRSEQRLDDAVEWFNANKIPLWGINQNPEQYTWTSSPKAYCNLYIDDAALGCPLSYDYAISERPFVNWTEVREILLEAGIL